MKLRIRESFQKLDGGDILLTDYAGDIANLLINKPKSYRILYNKHDDVYLIADAMNYIHEEMTEIAIYEGWLPKTQEFMKSRRIDVDDYDRDYSENIVFIPKDEMEVTFGKRFFSMALSEYSCEYPIETGSIFTKEEYHHNYLSDNFNDLYSRLKRVAVDKNYAFVEETTGWD